MDEQIGVYQDMLAHQARLRDRAEERRRRIRSGLVTIASIALPQWLNEQVQNGVDLEQITDDAIVEQVIQRLKFLVMFEQASSTENNNSYKVQRDQALEANKLLEQRLAQLRTQLQEAQSIIEQQKAALREKELELRAKEQELTKLRKTGPSSSKPGDDQEQVKALPNDPQVALRVWKQDRAYERQEFILTALAETSGELVFQQDIIRYCQQHTDWGVSDQVIAKHIRDLASYKLVAIRQEGMTTVSGGRPPNKVELTVLGRSVYRFMTGRDALGVDIERMDQSHVTPQHRDLILWAAHLLEENGYEIESLTPSPIVLDGGRQCKPDLLAFDGSSQVLIEVETDAGKSSDRSSKWINLWEASNGEIYVICESKSGQARIIAEVNEALADRKANFRFSNREEIDLGVRHESHGIWLKVRFRK